MSGGARDRLAAFLGRFLTDHGDMVTVAQLVNEIDHGAYQEGYQTGFRAALASRKDGTVQPIEFKAATSRMTDGLLRDEGAGRG